MPPMNAIFWLIQALFCAVLIYIAFIIAKKVYYRILIKLGKIELREIDSIHVGKENILINRKAVYINNIKSDIVIYLQGDHPLIVIGKNNLPSPAITKGNLLSQNRSGLLTKMNATQALAVALAENKWVSNPEIIEFLNGKVS